MLLLLCLFLWPQSCQSCFEFLIDWGDGKEEEPVEEIKIGGAIVIVEVLR
jgi:hypothetical protein